VAVLLVALIIILRGRKDPETQKWAIGAVGLILGFWLK